MERQIITRAEAKEQGLKRYFTGKPCRNGHDAEKYTSTGGCVKCAVARANESVARNPERRQAYSRQHYQSHKEHYIARAKEQYTANRERSYERARVWKTRNPCKVKAQSARYYRQRQAAYRVRGKLWREENRDRARASVRARRAAKLQRTPKWANQEDIKRVYAWALLAERATGIPHEVDHIIPLRGKNVSGLHVHNNLNPLMYWDHWGKGNSFEVE